VRDMASGGAFLFSLIECKEVKDVGIISSLFLSNFSCYKTKELKNGC